MWSVQVASFRVRANAERMLDRLKDENRDARITTVTTPKGKYHRLFVGQFADKTRALSELEMLRATGLEGLPVLRERPCASAGSQNI